MKKELEIIVGNDYHESLCESDYDSLIPTKALIKLNKKSLKYIKKILKKACKINKELNRNTVLTINVALSPLAPTFHVGNEEIENNELDFINLEFYDDCFLWQVKRKYSYIHFETNTYKIKDFK